MKKTTCKELRGVCDVVITGNTPEEMGENGKQHVMDMLSDGDVAHKNAVNAMMSLSKEDQQKWYAGFVEEFESLPEA